MIRPAVMSDLRAIEFISYLAASSYPLRPDKPKIKKLITEAIQSRTHFAYVSEADGAVSGALIAMSHSGTWFERHQLTVMLLWSEVAGDGLGMLKEMMNWKNRSIQLVSVGFLVDKRTSAVLHRAGIEASGSQHIAY